MNRRKFVRNTTTAGALIGAPIMIRSASRNNENEPREWYEIRIYSMKFGARANVLTGYLQGGYKEELKRRGAGDLKLFNEYGNSDPRDIWCLISYPNLQVYMDCQMINSDPSFMTVHSDYHGIDKAQILYTRYESWLLMAFEGMPALLDPIAGAGLFEMRTYEGFSEDAVRRKIKMFNVEEIELFHKTGLHPIFFGEMVAGPYRPSLTYLLNFTDMAQRDAHWKVFIDHPEWHAMRSKEEYADSVSNIHKTFLIPF